MSELPDGWKMVPLADVCEVNPRDPGPARQSTAVSFVPMPAVSETEGVIMAHDTKPFSKVAKGYTRFRERDVIFAKITPCMENGKSAVARDLHGGFACGSTEFHVLRSKGEILPEYLWRFVRQKTFRDEAERHMTGAVGQRRVPSLYIKNALIPLPPLQEQRRIIDKLDSLLERSKSTREELARIPRLTERYKQAILAKAFRGDLTAGWRKCHAGNAGGFLKREGMLPLNNQDLPHLPNGWSWVAAGTLCAIKSGITLGKKRPPGTVLIERPYLRVANVQRGWLNLDEIKTTAVTEKEAEMLYLQPGDVLMNEGGDRDKLGRGWVWNGEIPQCIHQNHVFRLRPRIPEVPSKYLSYYANEFGQNYFLREGKQTTNLASISMSKISELPIPVAPPDELTRIVGLIEDGFAGIDKIAAEASRATDFLDRLDQATLARAFRGELVGTRQLVEIKRPRSVLALSKR